LLENCGPECRGEAADALLARFQAVTVHPGQPLLVPGEVCAFEAFVAQGCLRVYFNAADGSEPVLYFAPEGWWVTDVQNFPTPQPALIGIDAIERAEVMMIRTSDLAAAIADMPSCSRLREARAAQAAMMLQRRLYGSMHKRASDRYAEFLSVYPSLAARLPQYQIAAYVGISPEFLCKLRKRSAKAPES
jgi:CRP-like cAMP-binding protein